MHSLSFIGLFLSLGMYGIINIVFNHIFLWKFFSFFQKLTQTEREKMMTVVLSTPIVLQIEHRRTVNKQHGQKGATRWKRLNTIKKNETIASVF